jgi:hypothetical protein
MNEKGFCRKRSWPDLRYYAAIRLKRLMKNTKKPQSAKPVVGPEI